jgi:hypothetical protein
MHHIEASSSDELWRLSLAKTAAAVLPPEHCGSLIHDFASVFPSRFPNRHHGLNRESLLKAEAC